MDQWRIAFASLDISDPLVAWLVYRGEMVSSVAAHDQAMSFWRAGYLADHAAGGVRRQRYQSELALEELRVEHYFDKVSRLTGFYVFADRASARAALAQWGGSFGEEMLAEVGLRPDCGVSRHDAEWISKRLTDDSTDWMHAYLRGEAAGPDPIWELLVDGRALVYGTELRAAAYQVVKATWPKSLALLEVARVGVELDSDLGLISPMATREEATITVQYEMNFVDANNASFLDRFSKFDGPKNTADVPPDFELVLPDLRERNFTIPV